MDTSKITEKTVQSLLMMWCMYQKNHIICVPNVRYYRWGATECDIMSMTKARYIHEFEIKLSLSDYHADFKYKASKHKAMINIWNKKNIPNYFWFVTHGFEVDVPEYAGHMVVKGNVDDKYSLYLRIEKDPPLLHRNKPKEDYELRMANRLSHRITNAMKGKHLGTRTDGSRK